MASFLIVENASLATTYPNVCTAYIMYMTVPVTIVTAERYFSKLKLIKNFLLSFMSQGRLSGLALLLIENKRAKISILEKLSSSSLVQKQDRKISSFQPPSSKLR